MIKTVYTGIELVKPEHKTLRSPQHLTILIRCQFCKYEKIIIENSLIYNYVGGKTTTAHKVEIPNEHIGGHIMCDCQVFDIMNQTVCEEFDALDGIVHAEELTDADRKIFAEDKVLKKYGITALDADKFVNAYIKAEAWKKRHY